MKRENVVKESVLLKEHNNIIRILNKQAINKSIFRPLRDFDSIQNH